MIKVPAPLAAILDPTHHRDVSEPAITIRAEDEPTWAEVVCRAEHGESVSVIAHGDHVADLVADRADRTQTADPPSEAEPDGPQWPCMRIGPESIRGCTGTRKQRPGNEPRGDGTAV